MNTENTKQNREKLDDSTKEKWTTTNMVDDYNTVYMDNLEPQKL